MADGSSRAKRRRKALLFALGIFILGRIFSDNSRVCSNDRLRRRAPTPPGGVYVNVSISRQEPLRISPEEVKRINTMPADKAFCYIHQNGTIDIPLKVLPSLVPAVSEFEDQVVLLSLGNNSESRLGAQIVARMCKKKMRTTVIVCGCNDEAIASVKLAISSQVREENAAIVQRHVDAGNQTSVRELLESIQREYGHIDTLINEASNKMMRGKELCAASSSSSSSPSQMEACSPLANVPKILRENYYMQCSLSEALLQLMPNYGRILFIVHPDAYEYLRGLPQQDRRYFNCMLPDREQAAAFVVEFADRLGQFKSRGDDVENKAFGLSQLLLTIYTKILADDVDHRGIYVNCLCPAVEQRRRRRERDSDQARRRPRRVRWTSSSESEHSNNEAASDEQSDSDSPVRIGTYLCSMDEFAYRETDVANRTRSPSSLNTGNMYIAGLRSLLRNGEVVPRRLHPAEPYPRHHPTTAEFVQYA